MATVPRVSIVMPLFNDEDYVSTALQSCVNQTLSDVEIICVDDCSTDTTVDIVEKYSRADSRIRLIRQPRNKSAFEARRAGVAAARAPHILFLDGDDELASDAARIALRTAKKAKADLVGFGVEIVTEDGRVPRRFESALQPKHRELKGPDVITTLMPVGEEANGHLWRYLFSTSLLTRAYAAIPGEHGFYRANDLPIAFLALARAEKYVSVTDRLYRYHFRRGTSGHAIDSIERFSFLLSGIDPISTIRAEISHISATWEAPDRLIRCYESARLHMIASVLRSCSRETSGAMQQSCVKLLAERVGKVDVIRAGAGFFKEGLAVLSSATPEPPESTPSVQSILLHTAHLDTGGLQSVLIEQVVELAARGYNVTIAVLRETTRTLDLPEGVAVEIIAGDAVQRIDRWLEICERHSVDLIIDHHILYNENWPWHALAALSQGIPTIGWVHNFALRPVFDASQRASFLTTQLRLLAKIVTLSPTDVAYWKIRGLSRVVYLPNPPSRLALSAIRSQKPRSLEDGHLELVWWGRLDGPTKQVLELVKTARELKSRKVDFTLRIIGPSSKNLTQEEVGTAVLHAGVEDSVQLVPELDADGLIRELASAHVLVSTSAIEGAPLTLLEAQALGLPVVMYDLPWLTATQDNAGMIRTAPNDPAALADAIADLAKDSGHYREHSAAAISFARRSVTVDTGDLTVALIEGTLPSEFSPTPTFEDAQLLIEWLVRFAERNARNSSQSNPAELSSLRRQLSRARRKLDEVQRGASFRIGRVVTALPRKLRSLLTRAR